MKCHKGFECGKEVSDIDGKNYCYLAALFNGIETCDGQINCGKVEPKCKECGKEMKDGLDEFFAAIGIIVPGRDTNLCPDCLGKRQAEGRPIFD